MKAIRHSAIGRFTPFTLELQVHLPQSRTRPGLNKIPSTVGKAHATNHLSHETNENYLYCVNWPHVSHALGKIPALLDPLLLCQVTTNSYRRQWQE